MHDDCLNICISTFPNDMTSLVAYVSRRVYKKSFSKDRLYYGLYWAHLFLKHRNHTEEVARDLMRKCFTHHIPAPL